MSSIISVECLGIRKIEGGMDCYPVTASKEPVVADKFLNFSRQQFAPLPKKGAESGPSGWLGTSVLHSLTTRWA